MKKHLKQILALALTVVMMSAMATTVMATLALPYTPGTGLPAAGNIEISKRMESASNTLTVPAETFGFTFTAVSVDGDTTSTVVSGMPAISGVSATTAAGDTWTWDTADSVYYSTVKKSSTLETILGSAAWPHAGIYVYTLTETAGSTAGITYSQEEYKVTVHVINNGSGGYTIHAVGFEKTKDFGGNTIASVKADPLFTNRIIQESTLVISKTVTGAYGDLTKAFSYSITLNNIPGGATSYIGAHMSGATFLSNVTVNPGAATPFTLKHGESLVFDGNNGSTKLPAGVTYVLTETGVIKYTASVGVVINGAAILTEPGVQDASLTIGSGSGHTNTVLNSAISIGVNANSAVWTNDYSDPPTPTGILLDNLPFILLIIVGIGGIVGYIALKRRRAHH